MTEEIYKIAKDLKVEQDRLLRYCKPLFKIEANIPEIKNENLN